MALVDYTSNKTLASQEVHFAGGNWTQLNFSLTSSAETNCVGLDASTDEVDCGKMGPHSHICVQCGGEFVIGLSAPGVANIDYVYMRPGDWGVVQGTEGLASAAAILKTMGIKIIRQGGSFADGSYYYWKNWRGRPWTRPSLGDAWGGVDTLISGWGPFEMMVNNCTASVVHCSRSAAFPNGGSVLLSAATGLLRCGAWQRLGT